MTTERHICTCNSEFQDKLYGKFIRLMNLCKDITKIRCTVCGKVYSISAKKKE